MSTETPLSVLFLWHQHQPFYKDPLSNRYELPWVRLHATKDYYDMVALLDEFPKIHANFNLVPSMLAQLDDYAEGKAHDKFLALSLKAPAELSFEDHLFILENFFMANWETMIDPHPRYRELLDKRGRNSKLEDLSRIQAYFKEQDWRDLQVWFNLAWIDPIWKERDPFVAELHRKDHSFTEEEKHRLMQLQQTICSLVVAKHKELSDRGQIELTTSPFYHPILPLLIDTEAARMAMPEVTLPRDRFMHPEDARLQIEKSIADHTRRFGKAPQGMWPSEGSVSEAAAHLMSNSGIRWVATDEAILAHSVEPKVFDRDTLYEPYQYKTGEKNLNFFFRDHELSDAIGFIYAGWKPDDAADNFIEKLHGIRDRLKKTDGDTPRPHIVSIILDGENCWEYYPEDGLPFLRALYQRLSNDPTLETVRAGDYLDRPAERKTLSHVWSGSWIFSNFAIWIGHSEDNLAWDHLNRTRQFLVQTLETRPDLLETTAAKLAWEEITIAEGSDWCWWYGDDHSSANDATFDYLFRKHLMNVYSVLGVKPPEELHIPIKKKKTTGAIQAPIDFITPKIDGRITGFYEWKAAGSYTTETGASGTMHRVQNLLKTVYFGFDHQSIYFRLDMNKPLTDPSLLETTIKFLFIKPSGVELRAKMTADKKVTLELHRAGEAPVALADGAAGKIIEMAIPLNQMTRTLEPFELTIALEQNGQELERWPTETPLTFPYPSSDAFAENWII